MVNLGLATAATEQCYSILPEYATLRCSTTVMQCRVSVNFAKAVDKLTACRSLMGTNSEHIGFLTCFLSASMSLGTQSSFSAD